ncbi:hypothetical protein HLB44_06250 [Aquincola sp. S2]|uniref:GH16 domain-containing protein n=1 Tax=Pseudaquabacterium terrae TaxID=2732868 RepID=A0ABX2ECB4_9BURK|nr:hypothetical protein [Aquabacterium terrae]
MKSGAAITSVPFVSGCGGGEDLGDAPDQQAQRIVARPDEPTAVGSVTPLERGTPPTRPTTPIASSARYRNGHKYLFQSSSWDVQQPRIPGGAARTAAFGPTSEFVDRHCGWPWDKVGGDWLDRDGERHGPKPWASIVTLKAPTSLVKAYTLDVTDLMKKVEAEDRWAAFRLATTLAPRKIAGTWNKTHAKPALQVQYTDGSSVSLNCIITSVMKPGIPNSVAPIVSTPCFMEFERPTKPVLSASLTLTVVEHPGNASAAVEVFLVDPPLNTDPVRQGVAASAGRLDAGIQSAPGIIGAQRYVDGTHLDEFVHPGAAINKWASREFDPALWGGTADKTKLPHKGLGKLIRTNADGVPELIESDYALEGFKPLAPGMGALRMHMKADATQDGDVVGYGGTGGASGSIFMPEPLFGRLPRIFVRYYLRVGTPEGTRYLRDPAKRYHVYHKEGQVAANWTDWAGKFGLTPDHTNSYGGGSGSSGGGRGWQMRLAWSDCDAFVGGPDEEGIRPGFHLYDFGPLNPPGYSYVGDTNSMIYWGKRGGLGGMLYANEWYCVETELKLNTVMDSLPGFLPDGELRAWIDGRLVFERTGLVFRSKPLYTAVLRPDLMGPVRDLGVRALWLNWYHGGVTQNSVPRTMFMTGLAWGQQYIGPMKM